jgi:hypothetical protein
MSERGCDNDSGNARLLHGCVCMKTERKSQTKINKTIVRDEGTSFFRHSKEDKLSFMPVMDADGELSGSLVSVEENS